MSYDIISGECHFYSVGGKDLGIVDFEYFIKNVPIKNLQEICNKYEKIIFKNGIVKESSELCMYKGIPVIPKTQYKPSDDARDEMKDLLKTTIIIDNNGRVNVKFNIIGYGVYHDQLQDSNIVSPKLTSKDKFEDLICGKKFEEKAILPSMPKELRLVEKVSTPLYLCAYFKLEANFMNLIPWLFSLSKDLANIMKYSDNTLCKKMIDVNGKKEILEKEYESIRIKITDQKVQKSDYLISIVEILLKEMGLEKYVGLYIGKEKILILKSKEEKEISVDYVSQTFFYAPSSDEEIISDKVFDSKTYNCLGFIYQSSSGFFLRVFDKTSTYDIDGSFKITSERSSTTKKIMANNTIIAIYDRE